MQTSDKNTQFCKCFAKNLVVWRQYSKGNSNKFKSSNAYNQELQNKHESSRGHYHFSAVTFWPFIGCLNL